MPSSSSSNDIWNRDNFSVSTIACNDISFSWCFLHNAYTAYTIWTAYTIFTAYNACTAYTYFTAHTAYNLYTEWQTLLQKLLDGRSALEMWQCCFWGFGAKKLDWMNIEYMVTLVRFPSPLAPGSGLGAQTPCSFDFSGFQPLQFLSYTQKWILFE